MGNIGVHVNHMNEFHDYRKQLYHFTAVFI